MKEVDIISKVVGRDTSGKAATFIPGAGAPSVDLDDYLMKKIWDSVFEVRTDGEGNTYLFEKLPFVTQHGITMYADGGDLNLPSIYAGLPIDGSTLIRDDNGVLMINPDIDLSGLPDLSVYATTEYLTDELKKYVTLNTEQTIAAQKDFLNGLSIGGLPITKSQDDVIYLDANLVVRGGITMFGTNSVDVPTIMDAIATDNVNLKVVDGVLTFVGQTGGGLTEVYWGDVKGRPTLLSFFIDDVVQGNYLPLSGGQMTGNIGYTLESGTYINDIGIPSAGFFSYSTSLLSTLSLSKSFIGSAYNTSTNLYYHIISSRHKNGTIDGSNYGIYLLTELDGERSNLRWNKQHGGTWQGERVILDSVNWSNYVASLSSDAYRLCSAFGKPDSGDISNRPSTANNIWTDKSVRYYLATGSMTTGKPIRDGMILHFAWDNSGWNSQLYIPNVENGCMQYRAASENSNTTWGTWRTLIDSSNYMDYALPIKGGTLSGKIGINISPTEYIDILNSINSTNTFIHAKRSDTGYGISFGVGSGGVNRGLYDDNLNRWIIYCDQARAYLNEDTWVSQSGWGNGLSLNRTAQNLGASITVRSMGYILGRFGINGNGIFQISISSSPTSQDDVLRFEVDKSGNVLAYGGITMYSDIRKKTKLQDVELSLKQIADAPLIEHYYNSDSNKTTHVGSIAQYWADMNDWFCKLDSEGYYTMEIQNAALASAISIARELVKYESKTDRKIRLLKQRVKELEDKIEKLEKN